MNSYLLLGYAISMTLLWGYALALFRKSIQLRHQEKQ